VLTTLKDLVKINPADWPGPPLWAVAIGVAIRTGREALEQRLAALSCLGEPEGVSPRSSSAHR
jgi:hypothetical protein